MHAAGDLAHHLWGIPLWPFMPTSSWGCMIFDAIIAIWFLAGASAYPAHLADGASGLFSRRTKALPIVPWRYPGTTVWPRELPIVDCSESGVAVNCGKMPNRPVPAGRYSARGDADNVETQGGGSGDFD